MAFCEKISLAEAFFPGLFIIIYDLTHSPRDATRKSTP